MKNLFYFTFLSFLFSPITYGHHAFTAEFDANAPINITGKVVKVEIESCNQNSVFGKIAHKNMKAA